ncbi:MAG: hypothetical protein HYZ51_02685 [Candidatus Doudnabacteria bacterium]|nr:hypothetical protein [Candidatus Doudnabacteria bacterium]
MKRNLVNFLIVLLFLGIFLIFINMGFGRSREQEESKMVYKNTLAIQSALKFFSNDYDRFPSAFEFGKTELMQSYFSSFPPKEFITDICQKTWVYGRPAASNYTLDFCLASGVEDLDKGWHKVSENLE